MFSDMTRDLVESNMWVPLIRGKLDWFCGSHQEGSCEIFPSTNLELRSDPYCICKLAGSVCLVSGLFLSIGFLFQHPGFGCFFCFVFFRRPETEVRTPTVMKTSGTIIRV